MFAFSFLQHLVVANGNVESPVVRQMHVSTVERPHSNLSMSVKDNVQQVLMVSPQS